MQHDEVIWGVINPGFCSYKVRTKTQKFCKNKYNVTGLCTRKSCPLANSRYATIIEDNGWCYLYVKTIERAHTPLNMWEKIKLSRNFTEALKQINENLQFWPKRIIHRVKQRLTKIHQYLIRMRKLKQQVRPVQVGIAKKVERREKSREAKALKAAKIPQAVQRELISRLQAGLYKDEIPNVPHNVYEQVLEMERTDETDEKEQENEEEEGEIDTEGVEGLAELAPGEGEGEEEEEHEFVEGFEGEDDIDDLEDGITGFGDEKEFELETEEKNDTSQLSSSSSSSSSSSFVPEDHDHGDDLSNDEVNTRPKKKAKISPRKDHVEVEYEEEAEEAVANSFG